MADIQLPFSAEYRQGAMMALAGGCRLSDRVECTEDWKSGYSEASADIVINGNSVRTMICLGQERRVDISMVYAGATGRYRLGDVLPNGSIVATINGKTEPKAAGVVWIEQENLSLAESHGWLSMGETDGPLVKVMREVCL